MMKVFSARILIVAAPRGILYDPDNELAFGYFSIDWAILRNNT
ncbi:hypothetical protein AB0M54_42250 [Actinoplanes sp. NPDC051470]